MAKRYRHVPYIGLGFALASLHAGLKEGVVPVSRRCSTVLLALFVTWSACLFAATVSRNRAWKDGETLRATSTRRYA